mgnify:CR=1 FL=1
MWRRLLEKESAVEAAAGEEAIGCCGNWMSVEESKREAAGGGRVR